MRELGKEDNDEPNGELAKSVRNDSADSAATNPNQSQSVKDSELEDPSDGEKDSCAIARKATGPRTAGGKKRSRRNALKSGMFSSAAIVEGESIAEYEAILDELRMDRQPVGILECVVVEKIATIVWRQRRLILAQSAEVQKARLSSSLDSALVLEAWDRSRAGETSGGMLRHTTNPVLIEEAISILTLFRDELERSGFQKGEDLWPLRKLYGLDHDGEAPFGISHIYQALSMLAAEACQGSERDCSKEEPTKTMVEILNVEIEGLRSKQNLTTLLGERKEYYHFIASLVPPPHVTELFIRYEAHLGRELERTINLLERLQRMRCGQPVPAPIKIEI